MIHCNMLNKEVKRERSTFDSRCVDSSGPYIRQLKWQNSLFSLLEYIDRPNSYISFRNASERATSC